jgi:hypothetical protein
MFFGNKSKSVSLKGTNDKESSRDKLLADLKVQREENKNLKIKNNAAKKIQHLFLKYKRIKQFKEDQRKIFDETNTKCNYFFPIQISVDSASLNVLLNNILYFHRKEKDYERFIKLSKLLLIHLSKTESFFHVSNSYQRLQFQKLMKLLIENLSLFVLFSNQSQQVHEEE